MFSIFQVHLSSNSIVPDHCKPYVLSLSSNPNFANTCDHDHDLACDRCSRYSLINQEVELQLDKATIPQEGKEEMKFMMAQSKKNIDAWKSHILRYINQD